MDKKTIVTILGKQYTVTYGLFGEYIIDGKSWDEFWDSVPPEVMNAMAVKGLETAIEDPPHFQDIVARLELESLEDVLRQSRPDEP